jgi:hypothetical protein
MLDKTITIRDLLTYTAILTGTFLIMIFYPDHQGIGKEAMFSGAIIGVISSLFYGLYFAVFKEPLRSILSRSKSQVD